MWLIMPITKTRTACQVTKQAPLNLAIVKHRGTAAASARFHRGTNIPLHSTRGKPGTSRRVSNLLFVPAWDYFIDKKKDIFLKLGQESDYRMKFTLSFFETIPQLPRYTLFGLASVRLVRYSWSWASVIQSRLHTASARPPLLRREPFPSRAISSGEKLHAPIRQQQLLM